MYPGHCRMPTSGTITGKMRTKMCGLFLLTSGLNAVDESADYNRHCQSETECTNNEVPVINTYTQHTSVLTFCYIQNVGVCQLGIATIRRHCKNDVQARIVFKFDPDLSSVTISLNQHDSALNVRWTQFNSEPSSEHGSNFDQSSTLFTHTHESENSHDQPRHYTSSITSLSKTIVVLTTKLLLKIENMCFRILQNNRVDYWCEMRKENHKIWTTMRYWGYTFVHQASYRARIIIVNYL